MTLINMKKSRTLDGERVFRIYWTDMGSARSIGKVVKQIGVNPVTQRPYYPMAIWFRIYIWAIENIELSYSIFNDAMRDQGEFHTIEEWEHLVQTNLFTSYKKRKKGFEKCLNRLKRENLIF